MHRSPSCVRLLGLALASLAACASAPPIELGLHLVAGQSHAVALVATQDVVQETEEGDRETAQSITYRWREEVEAVDAAGNATVVQTYDAVFLVVDGPEGRIEYDSTRGDAAVPPAALGMDAVIGERLRFELSPRGEILAIPDVARMIDRVVARIERAGDANGLDALELRAGLARFFGEHAIRDRMQTLLGIFPDGPVREGDTWERSSTVRVPFPTRQENVYELADVDEDVVTILVRTRIRPLHEGNEGKHGKDVPPVRSGPIEMRFVVEGEQQGRLVVDRRTGIVLVGEIVQKLEGTMTLTMAGGRELTTPMELDGKIELATTPIE